MDRETEARLVEGLRRGEESAFDDVYGEYRARVFTFVLRMVRRREVAEELSQEVWLRVSARAASLREDTRLEPWLFTVSRNLCQSYWRTRRLEGVGWSAPELLERLPEASASPERRAESGQLAERLERGLARLPVLYREALLLVGVEGIAPAEAAAICGVKPEAMRKRLERARDLLAAVIDPRRPHPRKR